MLMAVVFLGFAEMANCLAAEFSNIGNTLAAAAG
jgi:hypothetical protein